MATRPAFAEGEWYHCFNRGVEKRTTFEDALDYERFIALLYLANDTQTIGLFSDRTPSLSRSLMSHREKQIVTVGAYSLMPNHYHLVLREDTEGGISTFMQKLGTAYVMYFNARYQRVGNLFMKPFRSKHVADDIYFQHLINYVHSNPAELFEFGWKMGKVKNFNELKKQLIEYPYGSLRDYEEKSSPTRKIIANEVFDAYRSQSTQRMMRDAIAYFQEHFDGPPAGHNK